MNNAVNSLVDEIDCVQNAAIYFVEGKEVKYAVLQSYKGFPMWFIKKIRKIPYPKGFTWKTIIDAKTRYCPDVDNDEYIGPTGIEVGIKSYLSTPIKHKEEVIGCININSFKRNAFDEAELKLLDNIAREVETAIQNAKQAEELNLLEIVATQIETAINNAKLAEALKESEERFRNMADTTPVMIWMSDNNKKCNYVNKTWLEFTGKSLKQGLKGSWMECIYKDDVNNYINTYENAFDNKNEFKLEYRLRRHDGEYRWILDHGIPRFLTDGEFAGYIGSCIDIDDRITAEKEIKQSLHEKELLLKELHHRVKNNLQIVSSLLSLQSDNINDKKVLEMFNSSRSRIDSMALIHEQLYSSPDFDRIDLSVYIKNLCRNIRDSLDQGLNVIELNMEIERIVKDINFAIPFSLGH
jgi:PAS domain S-box-containing protein